MVRSTFASFTTARLAIQANQNALAVAGQNIANVQTPGYTRQRLDQVSLNLRGTSSLYQATPDAHLGFGVSVIGVSQIRDLFLDTRYRIEMGNVGSEDKRLDVLTKLGSVFDETNRSGIDDQMSDLIAQLTQFSKDPKDSNESLVRSSAQTLAGLFRRYSKGLEEVNAGLLDSTQKDVTNINNVLNQIQNLNVNIRNSQVHGNPALELQDERNLLIDQLSTYVNINVSHSTDITMNGAQVDVLKIELVGNSDATGIPMTLIDDSKPPAQFSFNQPEPGSGNQYNLSLIDTKGVFHGEVESNKGTFMSALNMLNDAGEFENPASSNRGIPYYENVLDNLASTFAKTLNDLNQGNGGGDLFSANDGSGIITAANITISDGWQNGTIKIIKSTDPNAPSDDNSNIINMINAMKNRTAFETPDGINYFNGSFQDCFSNMVDTHAMDTKSTTIALENYISTSGEVSTSRDSVSGVNVDEEGINLMQYNNALNAASRLMTTLDEALNTIINGMGVVGR